MARWPRQNAPPSPEPAAPCPTTWPLTCEDDRRVPEFGIGLTNLVARASPTMDDLLLEEMREGALHGGPRSWRAQNMGCYDRCCKLPDLRAAVALRDATVGRRRSGRAALETGSSQRTLEEAIQ